MEQVHKSAGNPGYRVADPLGFVPRFGEVTAYSQLTGLSRVTILAGLRSGQFRVGPDGLIYPRPAPSEGSTP
jgi:hypothetical protein